MKKTLEQTSYLILSCLLLGLFLVLLPSCGTKEEIHPFTNASTIAQNQGRDPQLTIMSGGFDFDEIDVDNPVGKIPIPLLGDFVQNLANVFADVFVLLNDDWDVDQNAQSLEIPDLDSEYILAIQITGIDFKIIPKEKKEKEFLPIKLVKALIPRKPKLDFIETINIYVANEAMLERGEKLLLASYRHDRDALKKCDSQCLKLAMNHGFEKAPVNLMPVLRRHKSLFIIPEVKINSIPKTKFKIAGKINFQVKLDLPF